MLNQATQCESKIPIMELGVGHVYRPERSSSFTDNFAIKNKYMGDIPLPPITEAVSITFKKGTLPPPSYHTT